MGHRIGAEASPSVGGRLADFQLGIRQESPRIQGFSLRSPAQSCTTHKLGVLLAEPITKPRRFEARSSKAESPPRQICNFAHSRRRSRRSADALAGTRVPGRNLCAWKDGEPDEITEYWGNDGVRTGPDVRGQGEHAVEWARVVCRADGEHDRHWQYHEPPQSDPGVVEHESRATGRYDLAPGRHLHRRLHERTDGHRVGPDHGAGVSRGAGDARCEQRRREVRRRHARHQGRACRVPRLRSHQFRRRPDGPEHRIRQFPNRDQC